MDPVSPRIQAFREHILDDIAAWSSEPEVARAALVHDRFDALLLRHLNHAHRFVAPRARQVVYGPAFTSSLGSDLAENQWIAEVLAEIAAGEDLTPRLSQRVWNEAYDSTDYSRKKPRVRRWEDKDYSLNAYNVHHLHLRKASSKEKRRTTRLLYVRFKLDRATVVMVGDHNSFDDGTLAEAVARLNLAEGAVLPGVIPGAGSGGRMRELSRKAGLSTIEVVDGHVVLGAQITTSGHSFLVRRHTNLILETIAKFEPLLDDAAYCAQLFARARLPAPVPASLKWIVHYTSLLVVDQAGQTAVTLVHGLT